MLAEPRGVRAPPGPYSFFNYKYTRFYCASASVPATLGAVAHELVSVVEIAELLAVSRQRVHQLIRAYADFPEPVARLAIGSVWARRDIEAWAATHPRKPGRPTAASRPDDQLAE